MFLQKTLLTTTLGFLVGFLVISDSVSANAAVESGKNVKKMTVADVSAEEILKIDGDTKKEMTDLRAQEEKMPTITAEGDFVVPTYLLQAPPSASEVVVPDTSKNNSLKIQTEHIQTNTKTVRNLPVVKITQTELTPVAEQMAIERFLTGKTTKTTKMYKEALARQNKNKLKDKNEMADLDVDDIVEQDGVVQDKVQKKKLLLPLKPARETVELEEDLSDVKPIYKVISSTMADKVLSEAREQTENGLLMPHDIKVSFYPNSTEFSGQTIKWIKAFSLRALNDPRYIVNVRLSRENPTIQQKRLFVIQRLLKNSGLSTHQIAVDYVDRPTDSLVLRMVEKQEDVEVRQVQMKNGKVKENKTINW